MSIILHNPSIIAASSKSTLTDPELRGRIMDGGIIQDYAESHNPPRILAIITILVESPPEEIIRESRIMRMMDSLTLK
jgi:hypothetical protein